MTAVAVSTIAPSVQNISPEMEKKLILLGDQIARDLAKEFFTDLTQHDLKSSQGTQHFIGFLNAQYSPATLDPKIAQLNDKVKFVFERVVFLAMNTMNPSNGPAKTVKDLGRMLTQTFGLQFSLVESLIKKQILVQVAELEKILSSEDSASAVTMASQTAAAPAPATK